VDRPPAAEAALGWRFVVEVEAATRRTARLPRVVADGLEAERVLEQSRGSRRA
jgi:hypothetical protein